VDGTDVDGISVGLVDGVSVGLLDGINDEGDSDVG
jgi:hypothetical protein